MMTADTDTFREYQVAMMEKLGFTLEQAVDLCDAERLVTAHNKMGVERSYMIRMDYTYVRNMIANGATPEQVVAILL